MTAAADRHLLFGLLALSERSHPPGPSSSPPSRPDADKARSLAHHLEARGDLTPAPRKCCPGCAGRGSPLQGTAASRRAWPPSPPTDPPARAWPTWASPRSRPRSPGSHGPRTAMPPRLTMTTTPTAPAICPSARRPAMASGSACSGRTLGAGWVRFRGAGQRAAPRGGAEADPREARRRPGEPPAVRAEARMTGGLEHPGIVPVYGLGTYGSPPVLRHAVHQGRLLQGGHRALPPRPPLNNDPGRRSFELRKLLRRFSRRFQRHRLCPFSRRDPSRREAGQHHPGQHGETLVVDGAWPRR